MPRQININHLRINDERIKSYVDTETAKAGKHEIVNSAGTALPPEPNIRFNGLDARDDATVSTTEIEAKGLNVDDLAEIVSTTPANYAVGNTAMYSTTEQIVGRWIDGKPVYQKTIVVNNPDKSWGVNDIGLNGVAEIVIDASYIYGNSSRFQTAPWWNSADDFVSVCISNGYFFCKMSSHQASITDWVKLTVKYTKVGD